MNKKIKVFYLIIFFFLKFTYSQCEGIYFHQSKYIFNPINIKIDFEQNGKELKIKTSDKYGVLEIPNNYHFVFKAKMLSKKGLDFTLYHHNLDKYYAFNSRKNFLLKKILI